MIEVMVERVETLDVGEELTLLARHAQVGNPLALDRLARARSTGTAPLEVARAVAVTQLRMLEGFATQLRWLEALTADPEIDAGVRAGLAGSLIRVCAKSDRLEPKRVDSHAAVLLEPALLLHGLLANIRPWLPSFVPEFEADVEFEVLSLGVPDYMLLVLRDQFESLWTLFHRLRQSSWLVRPETLVGMPSDLELFEHDPRFTAVEIAIPTPPAWPPMLDLVTVLARAAGGRR